MEVVIETQEEVMEQPVVIELSAECLEHGGRRCMLASVSEQLQDGDCVGQTSSAGVTNKTPRIAGRFLFS